jgi:hypothetical protein
MLNGRTLVPDQIPKRAVHRVRNSETSGRQVIISPNLPRPRDFSIGSVVLSESRLDPNFLHFRQTGNVGLIGINKVRLCGRFISLLTELLNAPSKVEIFKRPDDPTLRSISTFVHTLYCLRRIFSSLHGSYLNRYSAPGIAKLLRP